MTEPLLTWNVFLTPLFIFLLGLYIHTREKRRERNEAEMAQLLKEKEALKERELSTWREHYMDIGTSNKDTLCGIKNAIASIREALHEKVDWKFCTDIMQKYDERIRKGGG